MGAEAQFWVFFGRDGNPATGGTHWSHDSDRRQNVYASVTVKGTCTRLPKML
jgi:hypothetical protein